MVRFNSSIIGCLALIMAFLIINTLDTVNCQEHDHSYLVEKNVCKQVNFIKYENFYNLIKLQCDWKKYVDTVLDDKKYNYILKDKKITKKEKDIYEIEFLPISDKLKLSDQQQASRYQTINENLFKEITLKSLALKNLNLASLDSNAFNKYCCQSTLETLDLSGNRLRRLDQQTLLNLNRLENLILSNNQLSFSEQNFKSNYNLKTIDISNNGLEYLPSHLLHNINELRVINLNDNNLKSVDACILHKIQASALKEFNPAIINLQNNPISCECDLFFLNRHLGYKLNLTCSSPSYYKGKAFNKLSLEDPSNHCNYKKMNEKCNPVSSNSELCWIITLAIISGILLLTVCCCCSSNLNLNNKVRRLREQISNVKREQTKPKPIYVNSGINNKVTNNDKEKLIET